MADRNEPGPSSFDPENVEIFFHNLFCLFCFKIYGTVIQKKVLRLVLRNRLNHVSTLIYRLSIQNGIVSMVSKDIANFLKMSQPQRRRRPSACVWWKRSINLRVQVDPIETPVYEDTIISSFLNRLSEKLNTNVDLIKSCIENVLTSANEIVLDFDSQKLANCLGKTECDIVREIKLLIWIPKTNEEGDTISIIYGKRAEEKYFERCIHTIENCVSELTSWYQKPGSSTISDDADEVDTFQQFETKLVARQIYNSSVTIVNWNSDMLSRHFAHFVATNLESRQKHISDYFWRLDILTHAIASPNFETPYILRSLHPFTRQQILHMVYKDNQAEEPTYEKFFHLFVLLRDVLLKLNITRLAMPKIGCTCGQFNFTTIFKMIKYVFQRHDIEIVIWKKNKSWTCYFCKTNYDSEDQEAGIESYRALYDADKEESEVLDF